MEKWQNMPYLLAAYAVVWVGFTIYLLWLAMRVRRLERMLPGTAPGSGNDGKSA